MARRPIRPEDLEARGTNGTVRLTWRPGAGARLNTLISEKQELIDSEVLRRCAPLVPKRTGTLERSGITGTVIGSGLVQYTAPYAKRQYYNTAESREYDPRRGGRWFERMKATNKAALLRLLNS